MKKELNDSGTTKPEQANRLLLKAGSLQMVVALSLVTALMLSSLVLLYYYKQAAIGQLKTSVRLKQNLDQAEMLLLERNRFRRSGTWTTLDLFGQERDSVRMLTKNWGLFEVGLIESFSEEKSFRRGLLIGAEPDKFGKSAIYLQRKGRGLALAGKSHITGNAYIPNERLQAGRVGSVGFVGEDLITGEIEASSFQIPFFSSANRAAILDFRTSSGRPVSSGTTLSSSFFEAEPMIVSEPYLYLADSIFGQVYLEADQIYVSRSAVIDGAILSASYIEIESGFAGSAQFIATDSISVGDSCTLSYPSLLLVNDADTHGKITLGDSSSVTGTVILSGPDASQNKRMMSLEQGGTITGQIYLAGRAELHGNDLRAHLSLESFRIRQRGDTFDNFLLDNKIDRSSLGDHFLDPGRLNQTSRGVIKYLQ